MPEPTVITTTTIIIIILQLLLIIMILIIIIIIIIIDYFCIELFFIKNELTAFDRVVSFEVCCQWALLN